MKKDELKIIIDYVEGRLSADDFKVEFDNNKKLQALLKRKVKLEFLKNHDYSVYNYFKYSANYPANGWNTVYVRKRLQAVLEAWLKYFDIAFCEYEKYSEDVGYLLKIQPSWLDIIDDQGIFDKIIAEAPSDVSKTKRIAWGKARIKELFRYDKTYPRWVQSPEWPIVNGKPLVFSHQSKEKKDDERVFYYFYDPDTKEETVVEQMY